MEYSKILIILKIPLQKINQIQKKMIMMNSLVLILLLIMKHVTIKLKN